MSWSRAIFCICSRLKKNVILRVPLIMGGNCEDPFLAELQKLAGLPGIMSVDILPYHDFGKGKSTMCGKVEPPWKRFSTPSSDTIEHYRNMLNRGIKKSIPPPSPENSIPLSPQ